MTEQRDGMGGGGEERKKGGLWKQWSHKEGQGQYNV